MANRILKKLKPMQNITTHTCAVNIQKSTSYKYLVYFGAFSSCDKLVSHMFIDYDFKYELYLYKLSSVSFFGYWKVVLSIQLIYRVRQEPQ